MDHYIDNLEECVFDYLVSHKDVPKSLEEIYDDISGTTGHRCSELNTYNAKYKYRNKFLSICYNINNVYENIHKYFKNNICYLLYSEKKKNLITLMYNNKITHSPRATNSESNTFNAESDEFIKYAIFNDNSFDYNTFINENETMTELIIKRGNLASLVHLINNNVIDLNTDYNKLINYAIKHQKYYMINKIVDLLAEQYDNKIKKYEYIQQLANQYTGKIINYDYNDNDDNDDTEFMSHSDKTKICYDSIKTCVWFIIMCVFICLNILFWRGTS